MKCGLTVVVAVALLLPLKAQLAVQGEDFLISVNSGVVVRQTGQSLAQGNVGLNLRGGFDYWLAPTWLLANSLQWSGTLVPSVSLLAQEEQRPQETGSFDTVLRLMVLDEPQLQGDVGLGLGYSGFSYWNGNQVGDRPMGELAIKGSGSLRWLVSSDFALDLTLVYGLVGGSFDRESSDLDVLRAKFWVFAPPRYLAAKVSVLFRQWPSLVVNEALKKSWGGWSYEIELYQSAIASLPMLQHNLMFEARLFSPFMKTI